MRSLMPYLWVGIGGFAGANARYAVTRFAGWLLGVGFPYGTFVINVTGSFLLGVLLTLLAHRVVPHSQEIRLAVAVGFLGAYTTFSTFEFDCHALLEDGEWVLATVNMLGSLALGLVAVRVGIVAAKHWP